MASLLDLTGVTPEKGMDQNEGKSVAVCTLRFKMGDTSNSRQTMLTQARNETITKIPKQAFSNYGARSHIELQRPGIHNGPPVVNLDKYFLEFEDHTIVS